jgi:DNA/RNA-binding domain of Phe-tRNA-synthetase-like protein
MTTNLNENSKRASIIISDEIKNIAPDLVIWAIYADVDVEKKNKELWNRLEKLWNETKIAIDDIVKLPNIVAIRQAYLNAGKEPWKYRGSAEALLRRVAQWKWLYQINSIVDINNYLSLKSWLSVGSYNLGNVDWDITVWIWKKWESYKWIWKDTINIENLPVFYNNEIPFWSPTSDSELAMITLDTKQILMMLISFWWDLNGRLEEYLEEGKKMIIHYSKWRNIETKLYK